MVQSTAGNDLRLVRIVIAEPNHEYRELLCGQVRREPDLRLVAEARDGREAIVAVERVHPDMLVLDMDVPGIGGLDVLDVIRWWDPTTSVLLLLRREQEAVAVQALIRGAGGYLIKGEWTGLPAAIRAVQRGEIWARRQIVARAIERLIELGGHTSPYD